MIPQSRWGFTLLELLVVLVIISLMSALVAPKITGTMVNLKLKTASKKQCCFGKEDLCGCL